jgi:hypothetical protein
MNPGAALKEVYLVFMIYFQQEDKAYEKDDMDVGLLHINSDSFSHCSTIW